MSIQAYATVSGNTIGADPGITIADLDIYADLHVIPCGTELDGQMSWANTVMMDQDAADEILGNAGFCRTSDWILSDGQYVADVVPGVAA